jgi:hypothetical protein
MSLTVNRVLIWLQETNSQFSAKVSEIQRHLGEIFFSQNSLFEMAHLLINRCRFWIYKRLIFATFLLAKPYPTRNGRLSNQRLPFYL